jgi:hypothetical protein
MDEDRRAGRIDAGRQVVSDQAVYVPGQPTGHVTVGEHLVVGDQHEQLHPGTLQPDTVREGAEVVAKMQRPGGPVAGCDRVPRRLGSDQ